MKYYITIITIISIIIISIFYEKKIDIFSREEKIQTLVKNISTDSEVSENTNYEAGDLLEYAIIIKPGEKKEINIETKELKKNIDIKKIEIDGKEIEEKELNNYNFHQDTLIKIIGEAKVSKENGNKQNEIIKIEEVTISPEASLLEESEQNEEEIKEKILENKQIKNINISKLSYSSNMDNLIKIMGENLEQIEFVNIGDASFTPNFKNGFLYILIKENSFSSGEHFIFFQLKNGEIITYNKKINFTFSDSDMVVIDINPKSLKNDIDRNIILQGKGLSKIISVQLSNNLVLKDTSFNIINDRVASLIIPKNLITGKYTLNIMGTKGIYKSEIEINIY